MSLDVMLLGKETEETCFCSCCDNKHKRIVREELYSANITHNLGKMADACGIYYALWRPEEINCQYAKDIIPILTEGLKKLKKAPKKYSKFNSANGWGMYEHFVPFVEEYLNACIENPESEIHVCR